MIFLALVRFQAGASRCTCGASEAQAIQGRPPLRRRADEGVVPMRASRAFKLIGRAMG